MQEDNKLIKDIETRLKTIMIGSLARFEKHFGHLWNFGDEPNTKQENIMREKWEDLREDILNHGNNQIRIAIDSLEDYINYKNKYNYHYQFKITNKE